MKQTVVRELATPELLAKIEEQEYQLEKLRMNHAVSDIENPMKIRYARRTVARLKTELNARSRSGKDSAGNTANNK